MSPVPADPPPVGPLAQRFSRRGALRSEWIYGTGYQGPSSLTIFDELAGRQPLWPGMHVLEVGSGLGGDAFRLVTRYAVDLLGLDVSADMTQICRERAARAGLTGIRFATADVRTIALADATFDLVWTRDTCMYLPPPEKAMVWSRLHHALRPDGRVLITDYCRGSHASSPAFERLHRDSDYNLVTLDDYAAILKQAGFVDVVAVDHTDYLLISMLEERERLVGRRDEFSARFSPREYLDLLRRWDRKITASERHELTWVVLTARAAAC